jgi:periplasmic protein TonB
MVVWRTSLDYAAQQRKPGKHLMGIGIVLLLHLVLGWALLNGLAQRLVEVIKAPIETKIIEEIKPPPPPPPENLPPPPKFAPPPPSFVPPPEVNVKPPPVAAPAITTTTVAPPPAPFQPAPPPAPPAPPAPAPAPPAPPRVAAKPGFSDLKGCAPSKDEYPAAAARAEATGTSSIRITISAEGKLTNVEVVKSAGSSREHKLLDRLLIAKAKECQSFKPGLNEEGKPVAASFDWEVAWKLD